MKIDKPLYFFLLSAILIGVFIMIYFNGTGNEADSIYHYLYAKYAFKDPGLYLNHWAKPFFTLLASPFAQFGFIGVKVFNFCCSLLAAVFLYQIAKKLELKNAILAAIFYFIFPLSFLTSFSGLTEPLSALMLMSALYLCLLKRYYGAALIISFLPFVRSEGLIFMGVFTLYFAYHKKWKAIPFLAVGHLIYMLVGSFHYNDLLWVFNKIPYAHLSSPYGSGGIFHFPEQLIYVTGVPLLILFCLGIVQMILKLKTSTIKKQSELIMIFTCFLAFFVAHALFWYFGIFNSMGLKRVLATVSPIIALFCLLGFNFSSQWIQKASIKMAFQFCLLAYIFIFPFTSNPAAVDWHREMNLSLSQRTAHKVASYLTDHKVEYDRIIFADVYLAEVMNFNPFQKENALLFSQINLKNLSEGDLIIWDNWHSIVDQGIAREMLDQHKNLRAIKDFTYSNSKRTATYALYSVKITH